MIPISKRQSLEQANENALISYSLHKYNAYITGRSITMEEAAKCVIYQSKWAASHDVVDINTKTALQIEVQILSSTHAPGVGTVLSVCAASGDEKVVYSFLVTDSESHWFFLDLTMAPVAKRIVIE